MPILNGRDGFFNGRRPYNPQAARVGRLAGGGGGVPVPPSFDVDYLFGDIASSATYSIQTQGVYVQATDTTVFFTQTWMGTNRWIWCKGIVKSTGAMVGPYLVGTQTLSDDDHGLPDPEYDPTSGRFYVPYGDHATPQSISMSGVNDISTWTTLAEVAGQHTYPKYKIPQTGANAGVHHLLTRNNAGTAYQLQLTKSTAVAGSGEPTWGSVTPIIDLGADSRCNVGSCELASDGHNIHFVFTFVDNADTFRTNVYYGILDSDDGKIYSRDRSFSSSSFPLSKATCDANLLVVNQGGSSRYGNIPSFNFDTSDKPHILYMDGPSGGPYDCLHIVDNGSGAWSSPATVGAFPTLPTSATHRFDSMAVVPLPDGEVDLYWVTQSAIITPDRDGAISVRRRSAAGVLGSASVVIDAENGFAQAAPTPVRNGTSSARMFCGQSNGDETIETGTLKGYAFGDSGRLKYNYSSLARTLFATLQPATADKFAIDEFITGMEGNGLWSAQMELFYLAMDNFTMGSVNWANPSQYTLAQVGSPTFTARTSFQGNGSSTKYNTGFTPSSNAAKATQNSEALSVFSLTNTGNAAYFDIGGGSGPFSQFNGRTATNVHRGGINTGTSVDFGAATVSSAGFISLSRTASNLTTLYRNGASVATTATASTGLANGAVHICGTTSGFSARALQMASFSAGRTAAQELQFWTHYLKLRWQLQLA
jgi:hypothetical protein